MNAWSAHNTWIAALAGGAVCALGFLTLGDSTAQALILAFAVAVPAVTTVARVVWRRDTPPGWSYLALGFVAYLAATIAWMVVPPSRVGAASLPGVVHVLYFASYSLFAAFLVRLVRARSARQDRLQARLAVVDGAIFTAAMSSVLWAAVVDPHMHAESDAWARAAAVAHPGFVAVLFALSAALVVSRPKLSVPEILLVTWLGSELAADAAYSYESARGTFAFGDAVATGWIVSATAAAALALHPHLVQLAAPLTVRETRLRVRLALLLVAGGVPLALAGHTAAAGEFEHVAELLVLTAVAFALVAVRLSLLSGDLDEQRRLAAELDELSNELRHRAYHDPLTGLGNRSMLLERLGDAIAESSPQDGAAAALLLLDIDGFKNVNDTLGHKTGDDLLVSVAQRLSSSVRPTDTVTRLGGDEFAVVVRQATVGEALRATERIVEVLRDPLAIGGRSYSTRASVGVCIAGGDQDAPTALRNAHLAMYAAKTEGGDRYAVFQPELHQAFVERHELERRLREAAAARELRLHYQPVIDLSSGSIVGAEALVRWQHPERGLLYPDAFIDIAERSGSIIPIGRWVLEEACRQTTEWIERGVVDAGFRIAVNISRRQLLDPGIIDDVADVLATTGSQGARVELEVTETALIADTPLLIERLHGLRELGVTIAMDDFGTGYSSLEQLRRLPIDVLKIDRGFIHGIDRGREEYALATAILRLATSLGKETIAEGVETAGQAAHLRALGTRFAQGYLFGRPVPSADFEQAFDGIGGSVPA